ncbi:uncharacterized protein LOC127866876 isoform X2 [Dreissena polymorpha]|uniref:uncharacterized protein LOC127866876 isoform X2 n=1 Tax=Dreissena polymorpha TaxID=45954 RepID=UPI002264501D|nr:uncharacterized protein LOC127866876 isoform X2 [Dreissena polymorpha]
MFFKQNTLCETCRPRLACLVRSRMRIVHVHWPRVSTVDGLFMANNGALRLEGKYELHRPGVLGYHKCGEFLFDLSAICLSIKETQLSESHSLPSGRVRHHQHHHRSHVLPAHHVTCTVGHIRVRFHGGAARLCQFLTSMYIKVYRRHLEAQIAKVIQETVQDDGQILMSALSVMASINHTSERHVTGSTERPTPEHALSEPGGGKIQRFLDSFSRGQPQT